MTNLEISKKLNIAEKTVYNWRKNRPELFKIIENGLKENNQYVNITGTKEEREIFDLLSKLNKKEKELYIYEIKARILRKELDK
jgi:Na+/phosphate symporter